MKFLTLLLISLSTLFLRLDAQSVALQGTIIDGSTSEPIPYASVRTNANGVLGDAQGRFAISVDGTSEFIMLSALGYKSDTLSLDSILKSDHHIFRLNVEPLEVILVTGDKQGLSQNASHSVERLLTIPVVFGQNDLIKSISTLPGIGASREGLTGLHVRGGSDEQNLYLLDGSTVYNPGHLFGFLSVFNPELVRSVDVYKNYQPAAFSKRLSSTISVHTKQGGGDRRRVKEVGVLGVNYADVGTFGDKSLSYAGGFRLMHTALLTLGSLPGYLFSDQPLLFAGMYDLNFKLTKTYANGRSLSGSVFLGDDLFGGTVKSLPNQDEPSSTGNALLRYGNRTAAIRYFTTTKQGTLTETLLNYTQYNSRYKLSAKLAGPESGAGFDFSNRGNINEIGFTHRRTQALLGGDLTYGAETRFRSIAPVTIEYESGALSLKPSPLRFATGHFAAFADVILPLGSFLEIKAGMRLEAVNNLKTNYNQLLSAPRMSLGWLIGEERKINVTYQRNVQPIHAVLSFSGGLPTNFWLPADAASPAQNGAIFSLDYQSKQASHETRIGLFTRNMNELVFLPSLSFAPSDENDSWRDDLLSGGKGTAYGLEIYHERNFSPRLFSSLAYTYSRSWRTFNEINQGNRFPYDLDRPHDIYAQFIYRNNEHWTTSLAFTYQSGLPVSTPSFLARDYDGFSSAAVITYNNGRLRPYHRLDLLLSHTKEKDNGRSRTLKFGVYNLYGRPNPLSVSYGASGSLAINPETGGDDFLKTPSFDTFTPFRFIPMFSYVVNY